MFGVKITYSIYLILICWFIGLGVASANNVAGRLLPIYQLLLLDESVPQPPIFDCTVGLVKDINPGSSSSQLSQNPQFVQAGQQLFFRAETNQNGYELWVTDGSTSGTHLVSDIDPGAGDSVSVGAGYLAALGSQLLFVAQEDNFGRELWRSDGTLLGTQLIRETTPGNLFRDHGARAVLDGRLYYMGKGRFDIEQEGLWVSDGTAAGTQLVKDTHSFNGNLGSSEKMARVGNKLVFTADGENTRTQPWVSDGTTAGTRMLKQLDAGSSSPGVIADGYTAIGQLVFFFADDQTHGTELWVTDGTTAGTRLVKDINPGSASSHNDNIITFDSIDFLDLNGQAVFVADDGVHGRELWISDGTEPGTRMIRDIASGPISSYGDWTLEDATVLNGKLYFAANPIISASANSNRELWVSDGTAAGTSQFIDLKANGSSSPENLFAANNLIFMQAEDNSSIGRELFIVDENGNSLALDIAPMGWSAPEHFVHFNGQILFFAKTAQTGNELWGVSCP